MSVIGIYRQLRRLLAAWITSGWPKITGQSSESNPRSGGEKCIVLQWDLLLRKENLRFQVKILRAQRWAEPPGAILSSFGCSLP
jgi:hypothetical protein